MDRNKLFAYHQWATEECLKHVQSCREDLYARQGANSFASIEETTKHVIGVEKLWLQRMMKNPKPTFEHFDVSTVEKAIEAFSLLHAEMDLYFASLTEEQWQETLDFRNMRGVDFSNTREEMLFTVINHASYHRGQVTSFLRQFGYSGIPLDYIYFQKQNR
ncbi:MAG TPA: DinB family protein [Planococcus sp. (in: firmicutes)]|nr:DinB family protein [Planococcus sp. (in: firmicutes)]